MTTHERLVTYYKAICRKNNWKYNSRQAEAIREFVISYEGSFFNAERFTDDCINSHIGETE